jgi:CRISPR system Cascade subunit CasA
MMADLLREPLFRTIDGTGWTLPGWLAVLSRHETRELDGLQAHHEGLWHQFTVQVAAMAMDALNLSAPPIEEAIWRDALLQLSGSPEAWMLLVADLSKPAFMQPPVPEGSLAGFRSVGTSPDALDLLVTAKNHDVKNGRYVAPRADHWVYHLIALQTGEGYSGKMNYGIARMNGGLGSRAVVSRVPGAGWSDRFLSDLGAARRQGPGTGGPSLLWTVPWDGTTSLEVYELDRLFVEVCRRVRLVGGEHPVAYTATSTVERVRAKDFAGKIPFDPWTAIQAKAEGKVFTVSATGFRYDVVARLLSQEDYRRPPALDGEGDLFVASAIARGQGKTDGAHERCIPIRGRHLVDDPRFGKASQAMIADVATLRNKVVKPSILAYLDPKRSGDLNWKDERPRPFVDELHDLVDEAFFDHLWRLASPGKSEADERLWFMFLRDIGNAVRQRAIASLPCPTERRPRALDASERVFRGAFRTQIDKENLTRTPTSTEVDE